MKRIVFTCTVLLVAGIAVCVAIAQPAGDGPGPDGPREGRGFGGPGGFRPPLHPLEAALDTDGDHQLSAQEIENAVAALKTLDKNENGKLDAEELRPRFGGRPGGAEGPGRGVGRRDGRGPSPDGPPRDRGAERTRDNEGLSRLLAFDKNEDGKLTKDELPERMQGILRRGDTNGDDALDKDELAKIVESFRERGEGRRPDGDRPEGRGGPDGPPSPEMIVNHAMRFDADGDGKLDRDELLEFAQEMSRRRGGPEARRDRDPERHERPSNE